MAQWPSALACQVSRPWRRLVPLDWMAKSMIVVVPPKGRRAGAGLEGVHRLGAAERHLHVRVPVDGTRDHVLSASRRSRGRHRRATPARVADPGAPSATMRSPSMSTSATNGPLALTTVPPLMSVFIASDQLSLLAALRRLGSDQVVVAVGTTVAIESPGVADGFQHAHVEVAHDDVVIGTRAPRHPPAGHGDRRSTTNRRSRCRRVPRYPRD